MLWAFDLCGEWIQMNTYGTNTESAADGGVFSQFIEREQEPLRCEALADLERTASVPDDLQQLLDASDLKLLHGLRAYQIELESLNGELQRTQAEAEQSKTHFLDLYDQAPVGFCILSEKGLIVEANRACAALLGTTKPALVNQPLRCFICKEQEHAYYDMRRQLIVTGEHQFGEFRIRRSDGKVAWIRLDCNSCVDRDGELASRIALIDIHTIKAAEVAIHTHEKLLQSVFSGVAQIMFVVDIIEPDRFVFAEVNAHGERLRGLLRSVWLGKTPQELFPAELADEMIARYQQCRRRKQEVTYEETLPYKGRMTQWETKLHPLIDQDGRVYRLIGTSQEITAHADLDNRLEQLANSLTELIKKKNQVTVTEVQRVLDEARALERDLPAKSNGVSRNMRQRLDRMIDINANLLGEARLRDAIQQRITSLTQREKEVMQLIVKGFMNKEVADLLEISQRTIEVHRAHLMEKLHVSSMAELVQLAVIIGMVDPLALDMSDGDT